MIAKQGFLSVGFSVKNIAFSNLHQISFDLHFNNIFITSHICSCLSGKEAHHCGKGLQILLVHRASLKPIELHCNAHDLFQIFKRIFSFSLVKVLGNTYLTVVPCSA